MSLLSQLRSGHIEIDYYYYIKYKNNNFTYKCTLCNKLNDISHIIINCKKYINIIKKRDQNIHHIYYYNTNINKIKFEFFKYKLE